MTAVTAVSRSAATLHRFCQNLMTNVHCIPAAGESELQLLPSIDKYLQPGCMSLMYNNPAGSPSAVSEALLAKEQSENVKHSDNDSPSTVTAPAAGTILKTEFCSWTLWWTHACFDV